MTNNYINLEKDLKKMIDDFYIHTSLMQCERYSIKTILSIFSILSKIVESFINISVDKCYKLTSLLFSSETDGDQIIHISQIEQYFTHLYANILHNPNHNFFQIKVEKNVSKFKEGLDCCVLDDINDYNNIEKSYRKNGKKRNLRSLSRNRTFVDPPKNISNTKNIWRISSKKENSASNHSVDSDTNDYNVPSTDDEAKLKVESVNGIFDKLENKDFKDAKPNLYDLIDIDKHNTDADQNNIYCEKKVPGKRPKNIEQIWLNGVKQHIFAKFKCFICDHQSKTIDNLANHFLSEHSVLQSNNQRSIECNICHYKFAPTPRNWKVLPIILRHYVEQHKLQIPDFIELLNCPISDCGLKFYDSITLRRHIDKHNVKPLTSTPCYLCGVFMSQTAVTAHVKYHCSQNPDRVRFECDLCNKKFCGKRPLKLHVKRYHEQIKEFLCSICTKAVTSNSSLEEHMFVAHGINEGNRQLYACDMCEFQSLRKYGMELHVKKYHTDVKSYQCEVCSKTFKIHYYLLQHMRSHTEKSFSCPHCDFKSARKIGLEAHITAHHTSKKFSCEICGYTSGYRVNVLKHRRLTHKVSNKQVNVLSICYAKDE